MKKIENLRAKIDEIDDEILALLNKRMAQVKLIGEEKLKDNSAIYRPERERAILSRLVESKENKLKKDAIEAIFYEIFALSRNVEMPQRVAFLGPIGTYTHQAARSRFGACSIYTPLTTIEAVFKEIENKECEFGVVPVENNTEGAVNITLDCLAKYENVKIVAEIYMDIHHSFASLSENIAQIKRIYSHPQGYAQCRKFLDDHGLGEVEFIPTKSTAAAAKTASEDASSAAICSKIAAQISNLPVIFDTIEDNYANKTRFFVLSNFKNSPSGRDKTSILAKTDHKPGGLFGLLSALKNENINITKLESRPIKQKSFKFMFYIDFEGYIDDQNVQRAVSAALAGGHEIRWLGSYVNQGD